MLRQIAIGLVLGLLVALPATAQDFKKGVAAYKRGDYATALKELRPLAAKGSAKAQNNLGFMYAKGQGVPQENAEAIKWFRKAAEQGHARAQYNLAVMHAEVQGASQDYAEAVKWYRKAAEQGFAKAQFDLAVMHAKGRGLPQNDAEAVKWYRMAAQQGHTTAQESLRSMRGKGRGVSQGDAKATKENREAAEQGHTKAQEILRSTQNDGDVMVAKVPPASAPKGFHVQLSSVKSKARAVKEAERLARVHESVLDGLEVVPVRADLGKRGVFYRLRAGPLGDRGTAVSLCRKLSARKQGCIVIKP